MAAKKEVKIIFQPLTVAMEHELNLTQVEFDVKGRKQIVPMFEDMPAKIIMKPGDTLKLSKEAFDELVAIGVVRTKKEMKEKEQLIRDKAAIYEMDDSQRKLMLFDLPYEVE